MHREGGARVLAFADRSPASCTIPLLVVPSPITRWTVLRPPRRSGLLGSLIDAGFQTYCLDWGESVERDRRLAWSDMVLRLDNAVSAVAHHAGSPKVALLGYSLGGTLACIAAARTPDSISALVDVAGPVDFSQAGLFAWLGDPRWFDPRIPATLLRATPPVLLRAMLASHRATAPRWWLNAFGPAVEAASPLSFDLLESWSQDHVPLPPRAYVTYVRELCQHNRLLHDAHSVGGEPVRLGRIACPVLAVAAKRDMVSSAAGVFALCGAVGSSDTTRLAVPGGHVSCLVGRDAVRTAHAPIVRWLDERFQV